MQPPNAPTAAASVGVESPNTIEPRTIRISSASGKNDESSILNTSCRSQDHNHASRTTTATQIASTIQYQVGAGTRSAAAAGSALAGAALLASALGAAAVSCGLSASFSSSTLASPVVCSSGDMVPVSIVSPAKSEFSTGAVAAWYMKASRAASASAGSRETMSCP